MNAKYTCCLVFVYCCLINSPLYAQISEGVDSTFRVPDSLGTAFTTSHKQLVINDSLLRYYVVEDTAKYTFSMIQDDLDWMKRRWPDYLHTAFLGISEFRLPLTTVRIGREIPNKRCVFLVGNIHAREDFSSKLMMKFLNVYLLSIEGSSMVYPQAKSWLDSIDIYILPVANPDGLKIAHEDFVGIEDYFNSIKDSILVVETYQEWKANGKGYDLNCTFDDGNFVIKHAGNSNSCPASEGYKGSFPAEPLETLFIQQFVNDKHPLITASFHTKGNILYWADEVTHPLFQGVDTQFTRQVAKSSGYRMTGVGENPSIYGCGLENYVRSRLVLLGICIELSSGDTRKQHPDSDFNTQVWSRAWSIPTDIIEFGIRHGNEIQAISDYYIGGIER